MAAYNMAYSLKKFHPDIPIMAWVDSTFSSLLTEEQKDIFDIIEYIPEGLLEKNDPALIKLQAFYYSPFENTIQLDVDGLCLKNFEEEIDEMISGNSVYKTFQFEQSETTMWAKKETILKYFTSVPTKDINTSFQFYKKEAKELFDLANKHYAKIPLKELLYTWGSTQPDELYLNIALTELGIDCKTDTEMLFMAKRNDNFDRTELSKFPILCLHGNKKLPRQKYIDEYDNLLIEWKRADGENHYFKWSYIKTDKHHNKAHLTETKKPRFNEPVILKSALIPISETTLIDPAYLVKDYAAPRNRKATATNHFNCTAIEFKDEIYFAYRLEAAPFCTKSQIAICKVDEDFKPLTDQVILKLHSELKGNEKGFHVEDPRLFIFQDELYISYTDGYQMAQAKISEDLQASESFYITKPDKNRTEKNWTFFEVDQNLYSVYDPSNQTIFKMDGANFSKVYSSDRVGWEYGEIRGGTTPIKVDDYFISFFHSSLPVINGRQYFMGAYLFSSTAPFETIAISKEPLLAGEKIDELIPRLSNKIFVVFPGGALKKGKDFEVVFGYNDYQCRRVTITSEVLKQNLKTIHELA